jgi:hypothetical protein
MSPSLGRSGAPSCCVVDPSISALKGDYCGQHQQCAAIRIVHGLAIHLSSSLSELPKSSAMLREWTVKCELALACVAGAGRAGCGPIERCFLANFHPLPRPPCTPARCPGDAGSSRWPDIIIYYHHHDRYDHPRPTHRPGTLHRHRGHLSGYVQADPAQMAGVAAAIAQARPTSGDGPAVAPGRGFGPRNLSCPHLHLPAPESRSAAPVGRSAASAGMTVAVAADGGSEAHRICRFLLRQYITLASMPTTPTQPPYKK